MARRAPTAREPNRRRDAAEPIGRATSALFEWRHLGRACARAQSRRHHAPPTQTPRPFSGIGPTLARPQACAGATSLNSRELCASVPAKVDLHPLAGSPTPRPPGPVEGRRQAGRRLPRITWAHAHLGRRGRAHQPARMGHVAGRQLASRRRRTDSIVPKRRLDICLKSSRLQALVRYFGAARAQTKRTDDDNAASRAGRAPLWRQATSRHLEAPTLTAKNKWPHSLQALQISTGSVEPLIRRPASLAKYMDKNKIKMRE